VAIGEMILKPAAAGVQTPFEAHFTGQLIVEITIEKNHRMLPVPTPDKADYISLTGLNHAE